LIWGSEALDDRQPWHLAFDMQTFIPTWRAEDEEAKKLYDELKRAQARRR